MESPEFDLFARESAGATTRRTVARSLAAILGVVGLGSGLAMTSEADSNKKKKRRQRKKKKKFECGTKNKICATPTSPCQTITCESHKCVMSNVTDGTSCGGGRTCSSGTCECPAGKTCDVTVSPSDMSLWFGYNDENDQKDDGLLSFVDGPGNPPHGDGSVQMTVSGTQRRNVATYQFTGTKLSDISQLKFTTYNASATNDAGPDASGYLHFNVDFNGSDTWQRRLVFVPSTNGTVKADKWQEWDAIGNGSGKWLLSGGVWPVDNLPNTTAKTWEDILDQYPQVRIRVTDAFLGIRVGEPYPDGFTGNVGSLTFGTDAGVTRFVFGPDA